MSRICIYIIRNRTQIHFDDFNPDLTILKHLPTSKVSKISGPETDLPAYTRSFPASKQSPRDFSKKNVIIIGHIAKSFMGLDTTYSAPPPFLFNIRPLTASHYSFHLELLELWWLQVGFSWKTYPLNNLVILIGPLIFVYPLERPVFFYF